MEEKQYLNFDLLLEGSQGAYLARVVDSPVGQDKHNFGVIFEQDVLNELFGRIAQADETAVHQLGESLFEAIFSSSLRSTLNRSLDEAERQGKGLRLRLRLSEAPDLINLPWEMLFDPLPQRYFARSVDTPVVRFMDLPDRARELEVKPPLRVLVMISSPTDFPALDAESEWSRLKQALEPLEKNGMLIVEQLHIATLPMLQQHLRQNDYHIFHFLGHGLTDESKKTGALVFETEDGRGKYVDSQMLSTLLFDEKSIRLVVLNACQGAQTWASNPFGGVAQGLVQQGIPAVVAMQFPVSDGAAIAFSRGFYSALADYLPVDAAMGEARKAIYLEGNAVEWATPVLYLRSDRAAIFGKLEPGMPATPAITKVVEAASQSTLEPAPLVETTNGLELPGKWLIVSEDLWELTVDCHPAEAPGSPAQFSADLYHRPARTWINDELEGKWTYDPAKKRLSFNGKYIAYDDRFSLTLLVGRGQHGFFNAKDSQGATYKLTHITGEFQPVGKWLITYEMDGPSELEIEFLPHASGSLSMGEFTAVESYKVSKRWTAEDVSGQWTYDPAKKRLALSGKYAGSDNRFSLTPYIKGWEYNHFTGKDHDGLEFSLTRIG